MAHVPRFDTALRQARRISSTLKKKVSAEQPDENTPPQTTRNKEESVPRRFHSSAEANRDVEQNLQLVIWQT